MTIRSSACLRASGLSCSGLVIRVSDFLRHLAFVIRHLEIRLTPIVVIEIWDLHCHLSGVPGSTPEARLERLLEYANRMGIARLCVFMGMDWSYDPSPEKMRQENDEVLRAVRSFPERAFGFVYLNPKHTQATI